MDNSRELEEFLRLETSEATHESSGVFSISLEQAIQKLAAFTLPRQGSWALKLVQAAVALGCQQIEIQQKRHTCEIRLQGGESLSLDWLQEQFFSVQTASPAEDHVKRALWKVGLSEKRPFSLQFPRQEGLVWNGQAFRRTPPSSEPETLVVVAHPASSRAAENAQVALELSQCAYVCPIPLLLDGRRLDAIQFCPTQGLNHSSYPVKLGFLPSQNLPPVGLPQATIQFKRPKNASATYERILDSRLEIPSRFSVLCLVSAHFAGESESKLLKQQSSYLHWIRDGVVVDRRELPVAKGGFSLAIFASADDLQSDVTSFTLVDSDDQKRRTVAILQTALPFLAGIELQTEALIKAIAAPARSVGVALVVGGLVLSLFAGPGGLAVCLPGFIGTNMADYTKVTYELKEELKALQQRYREMCAGFGIEGGLSAS